MDKVDEAIQSSKANDPVDEQLVLEDSELVLVTFQKRDIGAITSRHEAQVSDHIKAAGSCVDILKKEYRLPCRLSQSCLLASVVLAVQRLRLKKQAGARQSARLTTFIRQEAPKKIEELARACNLPPRGPYGINDLEAVAAELGPTYQISVYRSSSPPVIAFGANGAENHIDILVRDDLKELPSVVGGWDQDWPTGYAVCITSITGFMGCKRWCYLCRKTATGRHRCAESLCNSCKLSNCPNQDDGPHIRQHKCGKCNRSWPTALCYQSHVDSGICRRMKLCDVCHELFTISAFADHSCGHKFCLTCYATHLTTERCFIRADGGKYAEGSEDFLDSSEDEEKEELGNAQQGSEIGGDCGESQDEEEENGRKEKSTWYGDAETQCDPLTGDHVANLLVLQKVIPDSDQTETIIYKGRTAMRQFAEACIRKDSPFKDSRICFQNGSRFDSVLWYYELMNLEVPPRITLRGRSIISMKTRKNSIEARDSLLFLPGVGLSKFASTFGLEEGKGYFPHSLNVPEWVDFENPRVFEEDGERFPPQRYFHPENMRPAEPRKFQQWHEEQTALFRQDPSLTYSPTVELVSYCIQDVVTLRLGFEKFRQQWKEKFNVDCLKKITFPSFANSIFRNKFLKEKSIALIPPNGYEKLNALTSVQAFGWLSWKVGELEAAGEVVVERRDGRRGFECRIAGVRVDGYLECRSGAKHVLEYHGCHWHGCPRCFPQRTVQREVRNANTQRSSERLRALAVNPQSPYGLFTYHEIWEHEYLEGNKGDSERGKHWRSFKARWPKLPPLSARDAFFGGRTNSIRHSVKVPWEEGWRLHYLDFTSLYPAVGFSVDGQQWPVGHPTIFIGAEVDQAPELVDAFGLWQVVAHPPKDLYLPVLPTRVNGKLVFALCAKCSQLEQDGPCFHSKEERALHGTWFTEELKVAVQKGYQLELPTEVYDWPPERRTKQLFRRFMRSFFETKAKASAPPQDPVKLQELIDELRRTTKIHLTPQSFAPNPTARALSMFALNNVWGYFGRSGQETSTTVTDKEEDIYKLMSKKGTRVKALRVLMGGRFVRIDWEPEVEKVQKNGNLVLALMTTAYGRLKLYQVLDEHSEDIVYMDTDSVFYLKRPGEAAPATSTALGKLKDEILEDYGPHACIAEFYALGPKTYCYKVVDRRTGEVLGTALRTKGVSLTSRALERVSVEELRRLADHRDKDHAIRVPQFQISRDILQQRLFSRDLFKRLRFSSSKRFFKAAPNPQGRTLPYGFSASESDSDLSQLIEALRTELD